VVDNDGLRLRDECHTAGEKITDTEDVKEKSIATSTS
jgi:hypothetical protein